MIYPFDVLSNHFRCAMAREGRLNSNEVIFYVIGHKEDREFCIPMLKYLIVYLENKINSVSRQRERYSYLIGFRNGLKQKLEESMKSLDLMKCFEISVIGVPENVKMYLKNNTKCSRTKGCDIDLLQYGRGFKDGSNYNVNE